MTLLHSILNPPEPFSSVFGVVNLKPFIDTRHRNIEIAKVYSRIVADVRAILATMSYEKHRTYILSSYEVTNKYEDNVLFEFTCALCELRLSVKHYVYYLELETDSDLQKIVGSYGYKQMLRSAYRNTNYEVTEHNLEDSIDIHTNMLDHYTYFIQRLANANNTNEIVLEEDPVIEYSIRL